MRPHGLAIAAIWLALLVVYSDSFGGALVLDNAPIIAHDPRITALTTENLRRIWTTEYWFTQTGNGLYRPLTTLSYLFNYSILGNGARPAGYHWVNYALHAVNASLLYLLGLGIFRRKVAPALALAIIWAMHPVLTESVTNIVGRADLLAGFGILAGLLCYRRGLEDPPRRWAWFGAAALAVAVGVWSKESAIIAPLVAVVYDLCFPAEAPGRTRVWGYGCLTLPCLLYFLARPDIAPLHIPFTDNPLVAADFWTARLTALKVIGKYIALLLFPMRLSSDYSYNAIPVSLDWQVAAALAASIAIAALAIYGWRKDRRWFFFIALGAIGLAPTANLAKLIGTIMAERFLYVPAMGFAGCLVLTILAVSPRFRKPEQVLTVAVAVLGLAFGSRTYARNLDWADQRTMSQAMVAGAPGSYKGHAFYYGSLDDSVRHVEVALRILQALPDEQSSPVAYINAGKWFRDKGQTLASSAPSESAAWFQRSLDVLLHGERILKATHENRFEIYEQLGLTYGKLGDYPNALEAFQTALRQNFTEDLIREVSATSLQLGNVYQAEVALWRGLLMAPDNRHFAAWLIDMYARSDPSSCAIQSQGATRNVNLACPMVREQACAASADLARMFREGGQQSASAHFRDAGIAQLGCAASQYN